MLKAIMKQLGMEETYSVPSISPQEAFRKNSTGEAMLIDVREPDEWETTGSPKGCKQIALQNPNFVAEVLSLAEGDKQTTIMVCCKSGMRGEKAAKLLKSSEFTNILNVDGGALRWISENLPVD